ncbi:hypothetical protein DPMN_177368 [Dreissena polymorpha]|uniref:Uncharacterized protein n=1 Tax=Dreissena polymorpha TaxID=45954 RepID=A0A9D4EA73_DREPO|nr:hypothetical protein DPMN_177368 [Dreissena polymorpha]
MIVDVHSSMVFNQEKAHNLPSLSRLISPGVCEMCTAENNAVLTWLNYRPYTGGQVKMASETSSL